MVTQPDSLESILISIGAVALLGLCLSMVIGHDKGARWFSTWLIRWPLWFVLDKVGDLFKWLAAKVKPKQRKKKK